MDKLKSAVLIDGDNISPQKYADFVFKYTAALSEVLVKKVYVSDRKGDSGWKEIVSKHGFQMIIVPCCARKKSTADFTLVAEAMDLILTRPAINCFCVVSNDSDFSSLVMRLRANGKKTIGLGTAIATKSFRESCDKFVLIVEDCVKEHVEKPNNTEQSKPDYQIIVSVRNKFIEAMRTEELKKHTDQHGWIHLGVLAAFLKKHNLLAHYAPKRTSEWAEKIGVDIKRDKKKGMFVRDNSDTWIPPVESMN